MRPRESPDIMRAELTALIVDDEPDVCYLLSAILKNRNLRTNFVNSISEAKRALREGTPSLIFLDNHLPDGYGLDFIEEIKKEHPLAKIIMITAFDAHDDRENAYSEGVDYFIGKPFTREVIFQTLETLLP